MKIDALNNNGVINDFSLHQEVSMPLRMPYPESWQKEYEKEHGKKAAHKPVKLNAGAGRKLDFLRVLVALHEAGYFTDEVGARLTGRTYTRRSVRFWIWIWTGPTRISARD